MRLRTASPTFACPFACILFLRTSMMLMTFEAPRFYQSQLQPVVALARPRRLFFMSTAAGLLPGPWFYGPWYRRRALPVATFAGRGQKLGWFLIISGVLQAIGLIGAREVPYFWLALISAVLAIVIGLLLLRHTDAGLLFFSVLFIVYFMLEGIVKTIFALSIRPFPNWGWVLASGLVGIALSLYLWSNLSTVSEWMLGVLLGVLLVVEGAALTSLAWHIRREI